MPIAADICQLVAASTGEDDSDVHVPESVACVVEDGDVVGLFSSKDIFDADASSLV